MMNGWNNARNTGLMLLTALLIRPPQANAQTGTTALATGLAADGEHAGAALEFRRQAMATGAPAAQAGYYWAAAYEYYRAGDHERTGSMLDNAENQDASITPPALLLRGENAFATRKWTEAEFYYNSMGQTATGATARLASRRIAAARLYQGQPDEAMRALDSARDQDAAGLDAIKRYQHGHDKSPKVGGLMGLVPGLGYAYSGEFANAARSLILNSLFIFGMTQTADDEEWGAFAVISFFEITWYSGSIYGGIDAAHRYNQNRLDDCAAAINGQSAFEPDYATLPVVTLTFRF
jgi:hypothetical protein